MSTINKTLVQSERPSHNPSKSLSQNEIDCLYTLLGNHCVTLATAVAQILHERNHIWRKHACGILCFVKDYNRRIYCLRLYDLQLKQSIYEDVAHSSLRLKKLSDLLYTFDKMNYTVGLHFTDSVEAETFCDYFYIKQENRQKKKVANELRTVQQSGVSSVESQTKLQSNDAIPIAKQVLLSNNNRKQEATAKIERLKKKKHNRPKISAPIPSSFTHTIHAALDESFVTDEKQKELFEEVLSNMRISLEDKIFVRDMIQKTDNGMQKLFAKSMHRWDTQGQATSDYPSIDFPHNYLTNENNKNRVPYQDISIPSLIYSGKPTGCLQFPTMSDSSNIQKRSVESGSSSKSGPSKLENAHLSTRTPLPSLSPTVFNPQTERLDLNISTSPSPSTFTSKQINNESFRSLSKSTVKEIYDRDRYQPSSKLERPIISKTSWTDQLHFEVQRNLETTISEMISPEISTTMKSIINDDDNEEDENFSSDSDCSD